MRSGGLPQDTAFAANAVGALVHTASGKCLAPAAGAAATFGTADTNALALGADCGAWTFSFWADWAAPPGFAPAGSGLT